MGRVTGVPFAAPQVTTPFRATVADGLIPRSGGWRQLGPAVASVTLAGLLLAFIFQNVAQFSQNQFVSSAWASTSVGSSTCPTLRTGTPMRSSSPF
jgi:hypothetical protein